MRKDFENSKKNAIDTGNMVGYAGAVVQEKAKDTEIGRMLGWGGGPKVDPMQVLIDSALNIAMQNEDVQKALNLFTTIIKQLVEWVLPPLAQALTWLYDSVIVPVGNSIIDLINGVIDGINSFFKTSIGKMAALQSSADTAAAQAEIAAKTKAVSEAMDSIRSTFQERKRDLDDAFQQNVGSLKNLLQLGALTEADYATRMGTINSDYSFATASLNETQQ